MLPLSVLPDISPAWGEISQSPKLPISPHAGEMSGRTERGVQEYCRHVIQRGA